MAVYKDNATGTWRVIYRFTNWKGERKQTQKRGFATKREAQAWEHEAMLKQGAKLDMTFASFFEVYEADKKQRVKESTWESKSHVIRTKILPYFGNRKIAEIEAKDIIAWQNELMAYRDEKGKSYSADYLKTIHAQLTAIFNHAVNFYNLPYNPARRAGTMGNEVPKEMDFWTKEEYLKFSEAMMDKPRSYYAFEMLYWCGIRSGELLAQNKWQGFKDFLANPISATVNWVQNQMGGPPAGVNLPGHAEGDIVGKGAHLAWFAEESPEAYIPINNSARSRGLVTKTAQLLGMDVGTGGGSVSLSAPITITVQGNADASTVAQIERAARDVLDELERKLQELEARRGRRSYA